MNHYLLTYHLAPDYLERRSALRAEHLARAWEAADRGELLLGGALDAPADTALLLFAGDTPDIARAFAEADPYVAEGLVERWTVRQWTSVVGELAAEPLRL